MLQLLSDVQLRNDGTVSFDILLLQVVQQISAVSHHFQHTSAAVMVLLVHLQMLGQLIDSGGQNGDLNLRRTGVAFMSGISCDNCVFFVFGEDIFQLINLFLV